MGNFLGMEKRHKALVQGRPRFKDAHVTVGVWIIIYVVSGLELKQMEKGKTELTWGDIFHRRDGLVAGAFTGAAGV